MPILPSSSRSSVGALVDIFEDATFTTDGELFVTETEREQNVHALMAGAVSTANTYWYGFIDLSDTTNWHHTGTGRIDISVLYLNVDKASAARGSAALGVITRIDETSADVEFIAGHSFIQNASDSIDFAVNIAPTQLKCGVVGGTLNRIKTGVKATGVTAINTGTTLPFGTGGPTFTPAVGDIVFRLITTTAGDVTFFAELAYHAHSAP